MRPILDQADAVVQVLKTLPEALVLVSEFGLELDNASFELLLIHVCHP